MIDAMFELPSSRKKTMTITRSYAKEKLKKADLSKLKAA
jgi:ATP-dependent Clp protease ATP-binding subunit ClpX